MLQTDLRCSTLFHGPQALLFGYLSHKMLLNSGEHERSCFASLTLTKVSILKAGNSLRGIPGLCVSSANFGRLFGTCTKFVCLKVICVLSFTSPPQSAFNHNMRKRHQSSPCHVYREKLYQLSSFSTLKLSSCLL